MTAALYDYNLSDYMAEADKELEEGASAPFLSAEAQQFVDTLDPRPKHEDGSWHHAPAALAACETIKEELNYTSWDVLGSQFKFVGMPTHDLVWWIIRLQDYAEELTKDAEWCKRREENIKGPFNDWFDFCDHLHDALLHEINKRKKAKMYAKARPHGSLIEAIKSAANLADFMEAYYHVDIFHNSKQDWKYRCPKHGDGVDQTPAGVIHNDTQTWHCFVCNDGGDIIDLVEKWEGCSKAWAVQILARYYGVINIDRPLEKKPSEIAREG